MEMYGSQVLKNGDMMEKRGHHLLMKADLLLVLMVLIMSFQLLLVPKVRYGSEQIME